MNRLLARCMQTVDGASLAVFRIAFGAILLIEVFRYLTKDWIQRYYVEPEFFFSYYGFDWVRPWPGMGMYLHFFVLGAAALCLLFGRAYRLAAAVFFLGFSYIFLLDQTQYLNHFYLIVLLSGLLIFIPTHRVWSWDASRKQYTATTVPILGLWLLRAQLGIVYFYGGLAKLNSDWLCGEPMRSWLADRVSFPLIGPWFTQEWMVWTFVYGGLLLDLLVFPCLIWKRTRVAAFCAATLFHVMNDRLFQIGIFPWFMIAATTIFFAPDWPRRWARRLRITSKVSIEPQGAVEPTSTARPAKSARFVLAAGVYLAAQLLVPLRHHHYPGNVSWTEEGHRFAWHMKLRDKDAETRFRVIDEPAEIEFEVDPHDHLSRRQVSKMSPRPDMILQFAHYLADRHQDEYGSRPRVQVMARASLNGRPEQLLIESDVDLASQPRNLRHASWILPLNTPLPGCEKD